MSFASLEPLSGNIAVYIYIAAPYLALAAFLLTVVLLFMHLRLRQRLARLTLGRTGSIEETLTILIRDVKDLQVFKTEVEKYLKFAETRLRHSICGVGVVRFNAQSGTAGGGTLSSALALIDERGSGVVLSTLYARDRVAVYTKPVEDGTSTSELSDEERQALAAAEAQVQSIKRS